MGYDQRSDDGIPGCKRGNKISYTYDDIERLLSAAQTVTVNGNRETVRNNYSYTDDNLTGIVHNGFAYAFNYDAFGNVSDVSVAGKQAVRYEYEDGNGNLLKYAMEMVHIFAMNMISRIGFIWFISKMRQTAKNRIFTDMLMISREIFMQ